MVFLRLFAGASLESDGEALSGPAAQRHRLALLALLCVSHPRSLSRDKLMGYLWPERDDRSARKLLNQSLHVLRKALGEDAIVSAGDEVGIASPPLECDVLAFREALASGDPLRAAELYPGPLLDGFFLGNAPDFEHWLDRERERLRREWRGALAEVAERNLAAGDGVGAGECWRQLLVDDPYDAKATVGLMEALDSVGDRAGAIRQARLHEILLQEEFGAEPDPAVRALAARIRAAESLEAPRSPVAGPPVGDPAGAAEPEGGSTAGAPPPAGAGGAGFDVTPPSPDSRLPRRRRWRTVAGVASVVIVLGLLAWAAGRARASDPVEIRRIAVLPLANLTGDPQQDHFVAGMHDALISELAKVGSLVVLSRQSVLRYQGSTEPLPAIAKELSADAILEGAVFQAGDTVRITVQLVRAHPERQLISRTFTGPLGRALALQGTVARTVAEATRARVTFTERARMASARAVDPAAQEAYLSGLYHLERATNGQDLTYAEQGAEVRHAIADLEEAVALDSTWATAYAKLAYADHWMASGEWEDPDGFFRKSKTAALRAIALDDTESQAFASLGFVLLYHELDWEGAERAIRRANELDPNSHHWIYAIFLKAIGRHDEALAEFHKAQERNPASDALKAQVAWEYGCAGRHDDAIAEARELHARVAAPARVDRYVLGDTTWLLSMIAIQYTLAGTYDRAIDAAQRLVTLTDTTLGGPELAFALGMAGRRDEARSIIAGLDEDWERGFDRLQPEVFLALGDTGRAVARAAARIRQHPGSMVLLRCAPVYQLLRGSPQIEERLKPIGYPD